MELDVSAFACLAALTLVNGESQPTPNEIFNRSTKTARPKYRDFYFEICRWKLL